MPAIMTCGHAANGFRVESDGSKTPSCVICSCTEEASQPSLDGRSAQCPSCKKIEPSRFEMPFFDYRGVGSFYAENTCGVCGFYKIAHGETNPISKRPGITSHPFSASGPADLDEFYCGCRGWD